MNATASAFITLLQQRNIRYDVKERENDTSIRIDVDMKSTSFQTYIFVDDDNKNVRFRIFSIYKARLEQRYKAILACNECNKDYRLVKFYLNSNNDIDASYDIVANGGSITAESLGEALYFILAVADDAYPNIMKIIWE